MLVTAAERGAAGDWLKFNSKMKFKVNTPCLTETVFMFLHCMCVGLSVCLINCLSCFSGGGRDLDSEPGAVLQTILRVHVQHLIIDSSPLSLSSHALISLLSFISV